MVLVGIVLLMMGLVCLILGKYWQKSEERFMTQCTRGRGVITGYRTEDNSSYDQPFIRFNPEGEELTISAQAIREKTAPKVGTEVDIVYKKDQVLGQTAWDVRVILDGKAVSAMLPAKVVTIIGMVFTGAGLLVSVMGIISLLSEIL